MAEFPAIVNRLPAIVRSTVATEVPRGDIRGAVGIHFRKILLVIRGGGNRDAGSIGQKLCELAQVSDTWFAGESVLPGLVGHLQQDELLLATAHDIGEKLAQMLDSIVLACDELR